MILAFRSRRPRWLWCLLLVTGVLLLTVRPAAAQDAAPAVELHADYDFGQVMRFRLAVRGDAQINRATLFIRAPELANTLTVNLTVAPRSQAVIEYDLALSQVRLAPFTTVTYWWTFGDTAGNPYRTHEKNLEYRDNRFVWQQAAEGNVVVSWTGADSALGQTALDIAADALSRLNAMLPLEMTRPLRIYVYPSAGDLRSALRLTGRDWVGAHAQPQLGVVLVSAVNPRTAAADLGQSIPHELAHLFVHQATGIAYGQVPDWLDEGLATLFEVSPNPNYESLLRAAVASGDTMPFADLCQAFPDQADRALLAYAQSASLVRLVQTDYGNQALGNLVRSYGDGASCQSGVRRVLGLSLDRLERQWLDQQLPQSSVGRFWRANGLWLLLLVAGFALMGLFLLNPPGVRRDRKKSAGQSL